MAVGILLVTHQGIASSMMLNAMRIWRELPTGTANVEIPFDADPDETVAAVEKRIAELDSGDGVLILTDLLGATPCNLVTALTQPHTAIVTGLNLPMLVRAYNYHDRPLDELTQIAVDGGQRGIATLAIACEPGREDQGA